MFNFDWLKNLDLVAAKIIILCAFLVPFIFSLFLKKSYILKGASDTKPWRNLKIWIFMLTTIMVVIYTFF